MGKSTLSSFDSKAWKRSRPLVTEIQGLTKMSGVLLSLDVFSEPPRLLLEMNVTKVLSIFY